MVGGGGGGGGGKLRHIHCVVKVPRPQGVGGGGGGVSSGDVKVMMSLENEYNLLSQVAGHKCVMAVPVLQELERGSREIRDFLSTLGGGGGGGGGGERGEVVRAVLSGRGPCLVYVYPLYGVTMATKIQVCARMACV